MKVMFYTGENVHMKIGLSNMLGKEVPDTLNRVEVDLEPEEYKSVTLSNREEMVMRVLDDNYDKQEEEEIQIREMIISILKSEKKEERKNKGVLL